MNLSKIILRGVMTHAESTLDIPRAGVVLLTGGNGQGKSAFFDAAAYALFGKSVRGTSVWSDTHEGPASIEVHTHDGLRVTRRQKGGLTFSGGAAGESQAYETPTKALEALAPLVGDLDTWRMTSLFAAADMAAFTLASDGGRKEILEGILGLHRFEEAGRRALADQRGLEARRSQLEVELGRCQGKRDGLAVAYAAQTARAAGAPTAADLVWAEGKVAAATLAARDAGIAEREAWEVANMHASRVTDARRVLRDAKDHEARAARGGKCPTCGAAIVAGAPYTGPAIADLEEALEAALLGSEKADGERYDRRALALAAADSQRQSEVELNRVRDALRRQSEASAIAGQVADLNEQIEEYEALITIASGRVDTVKAAVVALRGVRGVLLADALAALESLTASYLALLGVEYRVTVGLDDAGKVTLSVAQASDGRSYKAASAGERRRVDLAMMLALGDLAAAARGATPGTLILDECLDSSLDEAGIADVVKLVEETAKGRAVIVITHNPIVINSIDRVAAYHVAAGVVERTK